MSHSHATRRKVTTCGECHRRKQKCNREKPCNFCLRRGVPSRCRYDDPSLSSSDNRTRRNNEHPIATPFTSLSSPSTESSLLSLAGYSPSSSLNRIVRQTNSSNVIGTAVLPGAHETLLRDEPFWDHYNQLVAELPNQVLIDELVAVFFTEANWHVQILDPVFFNDAYQEWLAMDTSAMGQVAQTHLEQIIFPSLLFQVLAIALLYLPQGTMAEKTLGLHDQSAKSTLSERWSGIGAKGAVLLSETAPTIVSIEHELARALWLKSVSRGLAAWKVLGKAIRQAQELGLHRDAAPREGASSEDVLLNMWENEHHRRLWVTLFAWDSHMAIILDRPRAINVSDCSLASPIGCDIPSDKTTAFPVSPSPSAKPPLFANRLFTYTLALKNHEILSSAANSKTVTDYSVVTRLHDDIKDACANHHPALRANNPDTTWDATFPVVKFQREMAKIMASSVLLTLHRDHIQVHPESREAAFEAAMACLEAQHSLMDLLPSNQKRIYGLSCHAIDACIFIAHITLKSDIFDHSKIDRVTLAIQSSIERLEELEGISPVAKGGVKELRRALDAVASRERESSTQEAEGAGHTGISITDFPMDFGLELPSQRFHPEDFEDIGSLDLFGGYPNFE